MTYDEILARLDEYLYALSTEDRQVRTGRKSKPGFTAIQERFADLFADESVMAVRAAIERNPDPRARDRMERTLFTLLEGVMAKSQLPLEEELLDACAEASAEVGGETVGWYEFRGRIAREGDAVRREALRKAQAVLAGKLDSKRLDLEHASRQALAQFGFRTVREYAETKKRIRYDKLLDKVVPILEETTGLYRRVMSDAIRTAYGLELGEVPSAHAIHWRAGREFDRHFPADKLVGAISEAFAVLGLPLASVPGIEIDAEDRPKKNPRASCYAAKAPGEVHLIIRPQGGYDDYRSFLHEAGHAIHFALTDAALPYEWRQLARSHALTEIFSFTMEHLAQNHLWLEHALRLPKAAAERVSAWSLLGNLFLLRRLIAKFTYELAFDEKPFDIPRNKALYASTLKDLTGFAFEPEFWLEDMDPGFYSADYLRAWIASAQLEEHLVRKFGDRWFLKRDSGAFLKGLYAKGVSWEAEELVQSLGMTPWDPLPLIRKFDGVSKLLR